MRWAGGEPVCPDGGCCESCKITTRRKFRCKACAHQCSVTSGTIFASRKLAFVDLRAAICIPVNAARGMAMVQLARDPARDLARQYKTAFVLAHKLRAAMTLEVQTGEVLAGHVKIDGACFGGHIRPAHHIANRVDRRRRAFQTGKRRVGVAMRGRDGCRLPVVAQTQAEGVALAKPHVDRLATMSAGEAPHWDLLHAGWNR